MHHQPQQFASIVATPLGPDGNPQSVVTQLSLLDDDNRPDVNSNNILACDNTEDHSMGSPANDHRKRFRIKAETNFFIIGTLLSFSLCASILNTFLLSFIIKSIQMSGKGVLNGNLYSNWLPSGSSQGQQNRSITSELPISLSDEKVFSSNRIESETDLCLEPFDGYLTLRARARSAANDGPIESSYITAGDGRFELSSQQLMIETVHSSLPGEHTNGPINNNNNKIATDMINMTRYRTTDSRYKPDADNRQQRVQSHGKEIVFKFDGKQKLAILNDLSSLSDDNFRRPTSAIRINGELDVSHASILGSPNTNLELQARNGDLNCRSNEMLRLISKAADVRLVAGSRLQTRSSKLVFNSNKGVYLKHLAVANDRPEEIVPVHRQSLPTAGLVVDDGGSVEGLHQFAANNAAPADSFFAREKEQKQEQEQPPTTADATATGTKHQQNSLRAYELIIVNGLLMAA